MKLRSIALAGVALAALSVPAAASDYTGWYLGLGGGYSNPLLLHVSDAAGTGHLAFNNDALGVASAGYKWNGNIRTELEIGYGGNSVFDYGNTLHGGKTIKSALGNVSYDVPLWHGVSWTVGAGIGVGSLALDVKDAADARVLYGTKTQFMWQGMTGFSFGISNAVDMFADYRFRSVEADGDYKPIDPTNGAPHIKDSRENIAMIGFRWYLE